MIAFEIKLNGKNICLAGAKDLCVLSAKISAVGKLGPKTISGGPNAEGSPDLFYGVTGLGRGGPKDGEHRTWKPVTFIKIGDVLEIKIFEVATADRPKSKKKAERKRRKSSGA